VNRSVYSVKEKSTGWTDNKNKSGARGGGVNAVRSSRNGGGGGGGGTFLTDMGDDAGGGDQKSLREQRAERAREKSQMPAGKRNLHVRVQTKKIRTKEATVGKKRHEDALAELKRRKADSAAKKPSNGSRLPRVQAKKGASAGVKTNNKYLQDFQKMKNNNAKRREPAPQRSRTSVPAPNAGRQNNARGNNAGGVGGNAGGVTRKSKTVPMRPGRQVGGATQPKQRGAVPSRGIAQKPQGRAYVIYIYM
jgi:hypothetical protein